jgi:signal transduction histidine kinase
MSSSSERRAGFRFSLRLTLWHALFVVLATVAVYFVSVALLRDAMDHEWELNHVRFEETWRREAGSRAFEMLATEQRAMIALPPAVRAGIERHFTGVFPLLMVPILVLGFGVGLLWTIRTTRPLQRLARTVQDILETGELSRRVPGRSGPGELDRLVRLFNRMLARNEALVQAMRDALDNVAHDLRTPMTRLRGTAERALQDGDDAAAREALADCLEESEQVVRLLAALMDIAEAESGAMKLHRVEASIPALLGEVVDLYELVAEEKNVEVELDAPAELTAPLDRDRMRQVFANLLDNAIKFGDQGGAVTIRAATDGAEAKIEFQDRGPGIADADLPRIWDRLYRGEGVSARGLGLGLSTVRAIVEAHGGAVDVETEVGAGTTFVVRLPLA